LTTRYPLWQDKAKSEMIVCVRQDLVIADQCTETHSTWQNPAELNGIKYLKSNAQVLMKEPVRQIVHGF
jgi:hypothetical protein